MSLWNFDDNLGLFMFVLICRFETILQKKIIL